MSGLLLSKNLTITKKPVKYYIKLDYNIIFLDQTNIFQKNIVQRWIIIFKPQMQNSKFKFQQVALFDTSKIYGEFSIISLNNYKFTCILCINLYSMYVSVYFW